MIRQVLKTFAQTDRAEQADGVPETVFAVSFCMADGVPEKVFAVSFCKKMNLYMWPPPLQKTKSQLTKRYRPQGPNQKTKTNKNQTQNQKPKFGFWFLVF